MEEIKRKLKRTKKDKLLDLMELAKGNEELVEFCKNEIALIEKKSASSYKSKGKEENERLMEIIFEELDNVNKPIIVTDLMNTSEIIKNYKLENGNSLSNQKVSAILKMLYEAGRVEREAVKGKTYFSIKNKNKID